MYLNKNTPIAEIETALDGLLHRKIFEVTLGNYWEKAGTFRKILIG